jgi:hypothetical protein
MRKCHSSYSDKKSTSPYPEKPTPALTNGQLQSVPGLTALRTKASTDYAARALGLVVDKISSYSFKEPLIAAYEIPG